MEGNDLSDSGSEDRLYVGSWTNTLVSRNA